VLQSVEHLLERELHSRQHSAVAASNLISARRTTREWKHSGACGDQNRQVGDGESETQERANRAPRDYEHAATPNTARTALMNVGVESYNHARRVNRKDGRRNLRRIDQIVGVSTEIHGSSQLAE
jgi:hypothetical protein